MRSLAICKEPTPSTSPPGILKRKLSYSGADAIPAEMDEDQEDQSQERGEEEQPLAMDQVVEPGDEEAEDADIASPDGDDKGTLKARPL